MKAVILDNGMKVIFEKRNTGTVCIEVNVKVGSNNETKDVSGISHFIEHLLFEGTKNRPNSYAISNEIEKLGGELNAATTNERTFFFTKVLNKHFDIALDVLSDILQNPLFAPKIIEKEKRIVTDEIKLVNDQPRYYQWILFQSTLYEKHPAKNPIYGSIESIHSMTRKKVIDYYKKYYVPNNMTVIIVGNVNDPIDKIKEKFSGKKIELLKASYTEPVNVQKIKNVKQNTLQSYMVLGYKTPTRKHKDSYTLDVVRAILGRGQSGKIFNEIRTKRGLAYDVGVIHNPNTDYGYLAVYVNTDKNNISKVVKIVLEQIDSLKKVTETELNEAKTFLEGEFLLQAEDNQKMADLLAFWDQADSSDSVLGYVDKIYKVTQADIIRVVKHLNNYTMTVIK